MAEPICIARPSAPSSRPLLRLNPPHNRIIFRRPRVVPPREGRGRREGAMRSRAYPFKRSPLGEHAICLPAYRRGNIDWKINRATERPSVDRASENQRSSTIILFRATFASPPPLPLRRFLIRVYVDRFAYLPNRRRYYALSRSLVVLFFFSSFPFLAVVKISSRCFQRTRVGEGEEVVTAGYPIFIGR